MVKAYVLGKVKPRSESEVKDEIAKIKGVKKVSIVYGEVDFVAEIEVPSLIVLREMSSRMRRVKGVVHTVTYLCREEAG